MGGLDPRLLLAVRDNAAWCDLIACLHGLPTAIDDRTWSSGRSTPDGYPDAISLAPGFDAPEVRRLLARIQTGPGASIKDSFADLDLDGHGFEVLFEATWIHRPAAAATGGGGRRDPLVADRDGPGPDPLGGPARPASRRRSAAARPARRRHPRRP